jgi:hypothetical protein
MSRARASAAVRSDSVATGCAAIVDPSMLCHPVHVGLTFHSSVRQTRRATDASRRSSANAYGSSASLPASVVGSSARSESSHASSRACQAAIAVVLRSPNRSIGVSGYPISYASPGN